MLAIESSDFDKAEQVLGADACRILGDAAEYDLALPGALFAVVLDMEAPETRDRIAGRLADLLRDYRTDTSE